MAPPPDSKPWPDVNPWPDSKPWPDQQLPDLMPTPDSKPPLNNNTCPSAKPLVLVSGKATDSDTTATATNNMELSATGCTGYTTPGPDRFYSVNLKGGKLYKVTLTPSSSFDPALYVITDCAKAMATCQPGMGSDRLGKGVVETVLLAPLVSSAYIIAVDAYASTEKGTYTVTVQEFNPPLGNNSCPAAEKLTFSLGVASASGNTHAASNSVNLPAAGCTGYTTPGPDLFYSVPLAKGKHYKILLKPAKDFDPAMMVFKNCMDINNGCQPGMGSDLIGNGVSEEIHLTPSKAGTFFIAVDSYSAAAKGSFLLIISEVLATSNDDCSSAIPLKLSGGVATAVGDTRGATNTVSLSGAGCTGYVTPGKDMFYSFDITAGKSYTVTTTPSSTFDPAMYIFTDCNSPEATCAKGLGSDVVGDGKEEKVTFKALASTKVLVGVDSFDLTYEGTFKLKVVEAGTAPCGPTTCAGCCWNNSCQAGTSKFACGKGGGTCKTCGAGKTCSPTGACVLDPNAMWRVEVSSASVMSTNSSNQSWDVGGAYVLPDPYVVVKIAGNTKSTSTKQDTLKPLWNETMMDQAASKILSSFDLEIWDSDLLADDNIGKCAAGVSGADLLNGFKTVTGCGRADITVFFYAL